MADFVRSSSKDGETIILGVCIAADKEGSAPDALAQQAVEQGGQMAPVFQVAL